MLEIGPGSGRNTRALEAGGLTVVGLEAPHADGALSTHALLHGTSREVAALLREIGDRLSPGAPLFATFGSVRDSRFAAGRMVEPFVYAPEGGDEAGVAHTFFDDVRLRRLLEGWIVESAREVCVDEIAGTWAHSRPLSGAVHWFVIAVKRP